MPESLSLGVTIDAPTQETAYLIGIKILEAVQKQLSGERTGRWYPAPGNPRYNEHAGPETRAANYDIRRRGAYDPSEIEGSAYRASAPGESPAVRTGRLRGSFYVVVQKKSDVMYQVTVRTAVRYADDLEFGTRKIAPRPFLEPAIQKVMPEITRLHLQGSLRLIRA